MSVLWLLLAACSADAAEQAAKRASPESCELSWTGPGSYTNNWGFALSIPAGRKAYSNSPVSGCGDEMVVMGDHGIVMPLSAEPSEADRYVEFYSAYNAAEDETAAQTAEARLRWIEDDAVQGTVRVLRRGPFSLHGLSGVRVLARYQDRKSGRDMVEDALEFLRPTRPKKGIAPAYKMSIYLHCPYTTYATDLQVFETLLSSVRFSKPQK